MLSGKAPEYEAYFEAYDRPPDLQNEKLGTGQKLIARSALLQELSAIDARFQAAKPPAPTAEQLQAVAVEAAAAAATATAAAAAAAAAVTAAAAEETRQSEQRHVRQPPPMQPSTVDASRAPDPGVAGGAETTLAVSTAIVPVGATAMVGGSAASDSGGGGVSADSARRRRAESPKSARGRDLRRKTAELTDAEMLAGAAASKQK